MSGDVARPAPLPRAATRGFSMIELAVVIGLVAVMAALAIPLLTRTTPEEGLRRATAELVSNLRIARSMAVASQVVGAIGAVDAVDVAFDGAAGTYSITGVNLTTGATAPVKTVRMSDYRGATLALTPAIAPTPATPVRFVANGSADRIASVTLREATTGRTKTIEITRAGLSRVQW